MSNQYCIKPDKVRENMYMSIDKITTKRFTNISCHFARILFHAKEISYEPLINFVQKQSTFKNSFYQEIIHSCRRIASKFIIRFIWVMFYLIVILVHICCVYTVLCKYIIQYTFTSHLLAAAGGLNAFRILLVSIFMQSNSLHCAII